MREITTNLKSIVKILQKYKVVLAFVFGSTTKGKLTKLSDLDLAILLDKSVSDKKCFQIRLLLLDSLGKIIKSRPLDVIVLNEAPPLLAQAVATRGKVIYCQDENLKSSFQRKTLKNYDDAIYLRKVYYRYLEDRVRTNHLGETHA